MEGGSISDLRMEGIARRLRELGKKGEARWFGECVLPSLFDLF